MQDYPLLVSGLLRHAALAHGSRPIVSRLVDEPIWRYDYAGLARRSARAAHMLRALKVAPGDRVSSLGWNTHRHMELMFAVPGVGAILHTANPRLSEEQIVYTINHAGSGILFYERNFAGLVEKLAPRLGQSMRFVMLSDSLSPEAVRIGAACYERLLEQQPDIIDWPRLAENMGAFLCYTSGTTGDPKGVLYSHRSTVLHAMAISLKSAFGLDACDCIMPCSSFYHATGWGLPFAGALNGCAFALPGQSMDPASLHELILNEGVTFSCGVPTIWTMYLEYLERIGESTGKLERVVIGGSAVPRAMAEAFTAQHGVKVLQVWGMTELNPIGVVATPTPALESRGEAVAQDAIWTRQGRLQFGVELAITDEDGHMLPHDGIVSGALKARGPWTIERYFRADQSALGEDGWFDTGDIASIDPDGFMRITDRSKDVIKSGGEWVSSIDIENAAACFPGVKVAAVIGVYHPKWEERPILILEVHDHATVSAEAMRAHLSSAFVKWWMPDLILFDSVPLTATGKIDKKLLRARYANCLND